MLKHTKKNSFSKLLRPKQIGVGILSLVLFVSVISVVIYQVSKDTIIVSANGKVEEYSTHAKTVGDLLNEEGIEVSEYDKLSHSKDTKIVEGMTIELDQAKEVAITVDGKETKVWTTESKVKNILEEANIKVTEHDALSVALDEEVDETNQIDIQRAFQVTLIDGKNKKQVWSTSTTVANFLKQQEIQLNKYDRVENDVDDIVAPKDKITVVRVEKVTDVVEESIDFAVQTQSDSSLLKGTEKVVTEGVEGKVARTYEVTKENGKAVKKKLKSEQVIKEPVTQVVAVGTKVVTAQVSRGNSSNSKSTSNSKEFYVTATAYTANCSGCSGKTATGLKLKSGMKVIAVDPSVIPLGTKVWVEGYGNAIAADTGGAIVGNKIDVFVGSNSQASSWGVRKVRIKILD